MVSENKHHQIPWNFQWVASSATYVQPFNSFREHSIGENEQKITLYPEFQVSQHFHEVTAVFVASIGDSLLFRDVHGAQQKFEQL